MALDRLGLVKTTLIDFPGEVAATVFTPGCNLRCPYCHNPDLVTPPFTSNLLPMEDVRRFITKRAKVLGGVCITGGEPLLYSGQEAGLSDFIDFCKDLGLKVKLDTNGCYPDYMDAILSSLDYVAMDIKTTPEKYNLVAAHTPAAHQTEVPTHRAVRESIEKIISSGVNHEFRTTMAPGIVGTEDAVKIATLLKSGYEKSESVRAGTYIITQFRPGKTLDPSYRNTAPYYKEILYQTAEKIRKIGIPCEVRGV